MSTESDAEVHLMEAGLDSESEGESQAEFDINVPESDDDDSEEEEQDEEETESRHEKSGSEEKSESEEEKSESEEEDIDFIRIGSDSDEVIKEKTPKPSKKLKNIPFDEPKNEVKNKLREKYEARKGKSLFVRFPHKLPTDKEIVEKTLKDLCSRIINVRRPRQNSTRFCLVDFDNKTDRDKAIKELKEIKIKGKRLFVDIPKTEKDSFVKKLIEKQVENKAARLAKSKLIQDAKKEQNQAKAKRIFTSTIIVENIPLETKISNIKELFPNAADIRINHAKRNEDTTTATVTMPTPKDATLAKRRKCKIGEKNLILSFGTNQKQKMPQIEKVDDQKKLYYEDVAGRGSAQTPQKIGKHKFEETSAEDLPSPKKNENTKGKQVELKGQQNKNLKSKQNKIKANFKYKAISNENRIRKESKVGIKRVGNNKNEEPFSKANKSGRANKFGKPFSKTNKSGEPFRKVSKLRKPFKKEKKIFVSKLKV